MPSATLNLQIPSLHDSLLLDARIYLPAVYTSPLVGVLWRRKVAVVAHPYAPLGGSYDDRVVLQVVDALLKIGWVVASFNFRGACGSKGRTTWTGNSEVTDYISVVAWVLTYVQSLPPPETPASSPTEKQQQRPEEPQEEVITLLIAGYSYGSLIASRLPSTNKHILPLMSSPPSDHPAFSNAIDAARCSARRWRDSHSSTRTSYSGSSVNRADVLKALQNKDSPSPVEQHWEDRPIKWKVISKYLLISPLLPPVSSFLMGFGQGGKNSLTGWTRGLMGMGGQGLDGVVEGEGVKGIDEPGTKVLAVYGDGDTFTSVKKYRKWKEKMGGVSKAWKGVEVEGVGHFWHENGAIEELEDAITSWAG